MKTFKNFIKEADVPTNVTGNAISAREPIIGLKKSNTYKQLNMKNAPKKLKEADTNAMVDGNFMNNKDVHNYMKNKYKNNNKIKGATYVFGMFKRNDTQ